MATVSCCDYNDDRHIESDSGGPAARSPERPQARAKAAFAVGRQAERKRKREETLKIESQRRQERRVNAKKRRLLASTVGCSRITQFLKPPFQSVSGDAPQTRSIESPLRSLADLAVLKHYKKPNKLLGILNIEQLQQSKINSVGSSGTPALEELSSSQSRLQFIAKCKKRATGGKARDSSHLATRFTPPCPLQRGSTDPLSFMILPVNVLSPLEQFPLLCKNVRCCQKDSNGRPCGGFLKSHGWSSGDSMPRKIFSMCGDEFVVVRVYKCTRQTCSKDTAASNTMFYASLPNPVQQSYGFVLSRRGGITRDLANMLMDSYVGGLPFESLANDRNARARERYISLVEGYLSVCAVSSAGPFKSGVCASHDELIKFGAFGDVSKYGGRLLSPERLAQFYKSFHAGRRDILDRSLQSMTAQGQAASFDDTFKLPKKIRTVGGKPYSCLKTIKSSEGCILFYEVAEQKGAAASLRALRKVGARLGENMGMHTMYSDQCCTDRPTFMEAFPSLSRTDSNRSNRLPPLTKLPNPLIFVSTTTQLITTLQQLRQSAMPASGLDERVTVALDAEWTAGFNSGSSGRGRIGVLQFSTLTATVVIDLPKVIADGIQNSSIRVGGLQRSRQMPTALKAFLEDNSICFVGVCVKNDCTYLAQDFGVKVGKPLDLRALSKHIGYSSDARKGTLTYFVESLLNCSLPCKDIGGVRTSRWSDGVSSVEQQQYAADDVWATALVYQRMLAIQSSPEEIGGALGSGGQTNVQAETVALPEKTANCSAVESEGINANATSCSVEVAISDEPNRSVKLDAFHFIQRLLEEVRGGPSKPLARLFAVMLSIALFEENADDRREVQDIALAGGASKDDARKLPRSSYKRRVRRLIPVPSVLKRRVLSVYRAFEHVKTADGLPFFKGGMEKRIDAALSHIEAGCLSDSPNVPLYTGRPGAVMTCGRGSSTLESFHRHLRAAFPGFSYGAELFDALLSEYVFRTNARAKSRVSGDHSPHSIAELVAFERLNAVCQSLGMEVPKGISNGLHALPANNGELFGLEDLGDWARRVRTLNTEVEETGESNHLKDGDLHLQVDGSDNVLEQYIGSQQEKSILTELVESRDFISAQKAGGIKANKVQSLLRALRGKGFTSDAFLNAVCGGEKVRAPTTPEEIRAVKEAMEKEEKLRHENAKSTDKVRKSRDYVTLTDIYNDSVLKANGRSVANGDSKLLCSTTPKQIESAVTSIEEVTITNKWLDSGAEEAAKATLTRLRLNASPANTSWPDARTRNIVQQRCRPSSDFVQADDPGTYQAASLSYQNRITAGVSSVHAVNPKALLSTELRGNVFSTPDSSTQVRQKKRICRYCKIVLCRDIPSVGHPKRCPNKTKADELRRLRKPGRPAKV